MNRIACCLICVAWLATGASANDIRIFLGQAESVPPVDDFVAEAHWGESAPPGTYTLGIWAEIQMDFSGPAPVMDVWDQLRVNINAEGPVTVSDLTIDNFDHRIGYGSAQRWYSPWVGATYFWMNGFYGVGGLCPREFEAGDGDTDWWSYTVGTPGAAGAKYRYWLGNVTLSSPGPARVWLGTTTGGVLRQGGDPATDHVYFGETDEAWWTGWIPWDGYQPDFNFTPEPGGLVLMALGALLLRRR